MFALVASRIWHFSWVSHLTLATTTRMWLLMMLSIGFSFNLVLASDAFWRHGSLAPCSSIPGVCRPSDDPEDTSLGRACQVFWDVHWLPQQHCHFEPARQLWSAISSYGEGRWFHSLQIAICRFTPHDSFFSIPCLVALTLLNMFTGLPTPPFVSILIYQQVSGQHFGMLLNHTTIKRNLLPGSICTDLTPDLPSSVCILNSQQLETLLYVFMYTTVQCFVLPLLYTSPHCVLRLMAWYVALYHFPYFPWQ